MDKINIKKGYKRLNMNMTSKYGNMQYELNTPYYLKGKLKICKNGYHLCKNMLDTVNFYDSEYSRLFEVEYNADNCIEEKNKICSDYIKIIREISQEEYRDYIKEYIENNDITNKHWEVKYEIARQGFGLDILINDENWCVRYEVARRGFGLDKLINDEDSEVRYEIARQGYGLDILVNDEYWRVRCEVAKQGFGLDKLINDKNYDVRYEVAKQGYGLDILVNDEDWCVRSEVAKQGHGLDKLINDKHWHVRCEVARQGYGLDKLINDEDCDVKYLAEQKLNELNNN